MVDQSSIGSGNIVGTAAVAMEPVANSTIRGDGQRPGRASSEDGSRAGDLEIMARVARGDANAQRQVVRRLLRRVERLCRALVRDSEEAHDARQLSLVAILRSAHTFRGTSALERWADRITVRTTLRAAAAERRARRAPLAGDFEHNVAKPTTESELLAREYLDGLSERQRTVVVMRHGLEYSIEDIAEATGISKNSVKDRLIRARGTLRRMYRRERSLLDPSTGKVAG
jgi:RNA polymerase sigma factor (sigma-70 family)